MSKASWSETIKELLSQWFEVLEIYDNGTGGANEVCRALLSDGQEIVIKTMLSNKKYHQRRKALTEATMGLLCAGLGGDRVVPDLYTCLFELTPAYKHVWGGENPEGARRICQVIRGYAPAQAGDDWRGEIYGLVGDLGAADEHCKKVLGSHPDAERISLLDFLTINQDRSARNWVTDHGNRFYAIDNGMAWFHEYPESDEWQQGCVIDDVILQKNPWQFISGVFTTLWAGRQLSPALKDGLDRFSETVFLNGVEREAQGLGFPSGISEDWRFEGILRRLRWIREKGRQPTAEEYRSWREGSELMTPPEIVESGGKIVWELSWDKDI